MNTERIDTPQTAVALGSFDGLHPGHMAVLREALSWETRGVQPCVLLFDTHPQAVLDGAAPPLLQTTQDKLERLTALGLRAGCVPFREIYTLSPEAFFQKILQEKLHAAAVCCGGNFRFGHHGVGTAETLRQLCADANVACCVSADVMFEGAPISSTRIRRCLLEGQPDRAAKMLGRPFSYCLEVVVGDRIGRTINAPTLNQRFPPELIVPKHGVYASESFVDGQWRVSMTNIGIRPTLTERDDLRSETHIIGYDGDLYGQKIPVRLLYYLREERRFADLNELKRQIERDCQEVLRVTGAVVM